MNVLIELGGDLKLERLGSLYDVLCSHNCWVLEETQPLNLRGKTHLGVYRMMGDLEYGPADEELKPCTLADWVIHCRSVALQGGALMLASSGERFDDDRAGEELQLLGVDFKIELPQDDENRCCALTLRPGKNVQEYIYAEVYSRQMLYSTEEILEKLDDPAALRALLERHAEAVRPLKLT